GWAAAATGTRSSRRWIHAGRSTTGSAARSSSSRTPRARTSTPSARASSPSPRSISISPTTSPSTRCGHSSSRGRRGRVADFDYDAARERMVVEQLEARGFRDSAVLAAMRRVPRHLFVEPALRDRAYEDTPLPIGERQTISQPYMVALMSEALELVPGARVLEVGTGSGYQAAVLAEMGARVVSLERIPRLAARAHEVLA